MSSARCTYLSLLDTILSRPLTVGQGGHWEAHPPEIFLALVRLAASLSSFLAREIKETFGSESKSLIWDAAAGYGRFRGEAIRRRTEQEGLPLDLVNMRIFWDLPKMSARDNERVNQDFTPYYHSYEVPQCAYNDIYQLVYPADLRGLHCEAMHTGAFKGYNPAIDLWMPALMPRGEAKCRTRLRIPPDEIENMERRFAGIPKREVERPVDDAATSYRLMARQVAIIYHFFMDTLLRAAGPDRTESVLRRALRNWGAWRGRDMQEAHRAKAWPLDLHTFITYHDDPAAEWSWVAENVRLTPAEYHEEITESAWSDLFSELGTGPLAALFFEETLPAQANAYNPQISMTIPRLKERGNPVSEFHYVLAESVA